VPLPTFSVAQAFTFWVAQAFTPGSEEATSAVTDVFRSPGDNAWGEEATSAVSNVLRSPGVYAWGEEATSAVSNVLRSPGVYAWGEEALSIPFLSIARSPFRGVRSAVAPEGAGIQEITLPAGAPGVNAWATETKPQA